MSKTFYTEHNQEGINLNNANACELLRLLGFADLAANPNGGTISSAELAIRCFDALESGIVDRPKEGFVEEGDGRATFVECERPAWVLRHWTEKLLELCLEAEEVHFA